MIAILALLVSLIVSIGTMVITNIIAKKSRLADVVTTNRVEWMQKLKEYISKYSSMICYYYEKKFPADTSEFISNLYELTAQIKLHLNYKGNADVEITDLIDEINVAFQKMLFLRNSMKDSKNYIISQEVISFYHYQYPDLFNLLYKQVLEDYHVDIKDVSSIHNMIEELKSDPGKLKKILFHQVEIIDADMKAQVKKIKQGHDILMILTQVYLKTEWERVKVEAKSGDISEYDFDKHFKENKKGKEIELSRLNYKAKTI